MPLRVQEGSTAQRLARMFGLKGMFPLQLDEIAVPVVVISDLSAGGEDTLEPAAPIGRGDRRQAAVRARAAALGATNMSIARLVATNGYLIRPLRAYLGGQTVATVDIGVGNHADAAALDNLQNVAPAFTTIPYDPPTFGFPAAVLEHGSVVLADFTAPNAYRSDLLVTTPQESRLEIDLSGYAIPPGGFLFFKNIVANVRIDVSVIFTVETLPDGWPPMVAGTPYGA